jgi:hypothetical protein
VPELTSRVDEQKTLNDCSELQFTLVLAAYSNE